MKLLLVEDDRAVRITVRDALQHDGFEVVECADGLQGLRAIEHELFDIVLTDIRLPGLSGLELFARLRQHQTGAAVVLMTAWSSADDAVRAMKEGARDYITKPFELDELVLRLGRVRHDILHRRQLEASGGKAPRSRHRLKGSSDATRQLLSRIDAAAASDVNVLITGETGTGKDLCAHTLHERSARAGKPFVAVNCAAIPETLLESELFGHTRGAFTGATGRREGRFEAADGGTLFLDEIGELPLAQQAKVLRAIDSRTIEPLGANSQVRVDVRLVAATNVDLELAIAEKRFRRDLFYRLNVIDLRLPALRERRDDIPELLADFLAAISVRLQKPAPEVDPAALARLCAHDYPGNVRELVHAVEHAVALARDGVIKLEHLPRAFASEVAVPSDETLASIVGHFERQYILQVLAKVGGHRGQAADLLGISRKALWQKLKDELPEEPPLPR
jgi:two-component system, NtrC family, response regulator AtoC